jgi:two-component system, cell cycle sensor histidine kinase and response regulator CckA
MKTKNFSDTGPRRWMVVDDNEEASSIMRQMLLKAGITQLECFNSSRDALAAFEATPESYDMVITDFQMPEMDGIELSRRLFQLAPKIKILLVTGSNAISNEAAGHEGFCGLLQKPFPLTALQSALDAVATGKFFTNSTAYPAS